MREVEASGRTVQEATDKALAEIGLTIEQVEVEVLDEGSRGLMGIGARDARVRVRALPMELPPERETREPDAREVEVVREVTTALVGQAGFEADVDAWPEEGAVGVAIEGTDLNALIGRHGQTLDALQAVVEAIASHRMGRRTRVAVDIEGYREKREAQLVALAHRTADRVRREDQEVALEAMSPRERRIIHTAIATEPGVTSESTGEGDERRVVISPKRD